MARIENTVFISYRRTDVYTALAVYENLKNQGYDVFFDYRSISSGDFEQIITSNIRARAHFLLILTPTALDRCSEPGDWLRREIEIAIEEKRNIIPLFFKGFRFGTPEVSKQLTGKLQSISRYNGLNVHEDYFDEAMQRVRTQFLGVPLNTVLHPLSTEVQKAVKAEQVAADKALEKIEDVKELAKQAEEKPAQPKPAPLPDPKEVELERLKKQATHHELMGEFWDALQIYYKIKKLDPLFPRVDAKIRELEKETQPMPVSAPKLQTSSVRKTTRNAPILFRSVAIGIAALLVIILCVWGGVSLWNNLSTAAPEPIPTYVTMTLGKDGMTLLYVPAGEFIMGNDSGNSDEKPVHNVDLAAFWIDKTEVTNKMYQLCEQIGVCAEPTYNLSSHAYGNSDFDDYPVRYIDWNMAKTYCEWVGRRLPTEAEWEKAARGIDGQSYPWGNDVPNNQLGNFGHSTGDTTEVGSYPAGASPYGALDMAGNVAEWVMDWYSDTYYASSPASNPLGPTSGQARGLRGGSWDSDYNYLRSSYRGHIDPLDSFFLRSGFRCAMSATP